MSFLDQLMLRKSTQPGQAKYCSGLITPNTLIRDNKRQPLRCRYDSETQLKTIPERAQDKRR